MTSIPSPAVLIIAGMHRSGTTLTARWLQAAGLYIGERLLASKYEHANPDGNHFEDLDFLEFHKTILRDNRLPVDGFVTTQPIAVSPQRVQHASDLIAARADRDQWGWKDPRTCLLLDFWCQQVPGAKVLVVYRHYANVVDSLLRRKLNHPRPLRRLFYRLRFTPLSTFIRRYLGVWDRYNRDALAVVRANPDAGLVLEIGDITRESLALVRYMNAHWGFQLQALPLESMVIKGRLKKQPRYVRLDDRLGLRAEVDRAEQTLHELEHWREVSLRRIGVGTRIHDGE